MRKLKRKFIQVDFDKYMLFRLGLSFGIHTFDKTSDCNIMGIDCNHAHIWVDLGFRCLEITLMDYAGNVEY